MLNLNSLILFSENPKALVEFYKKVLQKDTQWNGGEFAGFAAGTGYLVIGPHSKVHGKSTNPERMMFNFETADVKGEFARLKAMGAIVIQEPYQPKEDPKEWIATLADPDGNYFQLVSPMDMQEK